MRVSHVSGADERPPAPRERHSAASSSTAHPRLIAACSLATAGRETRKRKGRRRPALAAFSLKLVTCSRVAGPWQ
eukprot:766398-Hanusia_phi.AAC.2